MKLSPRSLFALALPIGTAGLVIACSASGDPGIGGGAPDSSSTAEPTSPLPSGDDDLSNEEAASKPDASKPPVDADTCVPVPIPSGVAVACAGADAGTCAPEAAVVPPAKLALAGAHLGACTPSEVDAFLANCLGPNAVPHGCESFAKNHGKCAICMMPDYGKDPHGVVYVGDDGLASVNISGCIAAAEPCNEACAQEYADAEACQKASCAGDACDTTSKRIACFGEAASCVCKDHRDRARCTEALTGPDHPAAGCLEGTTFLEKARSVGLVICGP